jgi:RNA polymerase sigma-70 factor (ECF subfamily)
MHGPDPVEALLDQLTAGDVEAAQRVFTAYAPYLQMVVRRQLTPALRTKFDSMDIVQSVWADLLSGFRAGCWEFTNPHQLRAFLVKVTRNRLIDRVRQQQTPLRVETRLAEAELRELPQTRPAGVGDQLEADEMWQRLLALCPPRHRDLLELKRQGLKLTEIAARTGLHEGSVRRILCDLAARLADTGAVPRTTGPTSP